MIAWWLVAFLYVSAMVFVAVAVDDNGVLSTWKGALAIILWPAVSFVVALKILFSRVPGRRT